MVLDLFRALKLKYEYICILITLVICLRQTRSMTISIISIQSTIQLYKLSLFHLIVHVNIYLFILLLLLLLSFYTYSYRKLSTGRPQLLIVFDQDGRSPFGRRLLVLHHPRRMGREFWPRSPSSRLAVGFEVVEEEDRPLSGEFIQRINLL